MSDLLLYILRHYLIWILISVIIYIYRHQILDLMNVLKRHRAHLRFLKEQIHNRYDSKARFELGQYELRLGNYREALRLFKEALETDTENADLHFYTGIALQKLRNFNAAATEFITCLNLKKDYGCGQALLKLGDTCRSQRDYAGALSYYSQMLTINPYEGEALYKTGFIKYLQGSHKEAKQYLSRAITEIKALPKFRYKKDRIWLYKSLLLKALLIGRN